MEITTYRIKQYNSTNKTVVLVDNKPVCIVSGSTTGKTVSNIMAYLEGYDVPINDGKIKKLLDKIKKNKANGGTNQ